MKIDAHQHFWKYDPLIYGWIDESMAAIQKNFLPGDLEPELQKHNIEACIAVQADQSERETEFLLKLAAQFKFIRGVVGWVDLNAKNVGERLKQFSKHKCFKGVRHTVFDKEGEFMSTPAFRNGIFELGKQGLAYDLLVFDYQLKAAIELVREFPDQAFVLDHMGKPQISPQGPSKGWVANINLLAENRNVYCKLSGMVTETPDFNWHLVDIQPYLDVIVEAFGTERLIFGSDWPVCLSATSYENVLGIVEDYFQYYPEAIKEQIFGENALRFYNL